MTTAEVPYANQNDIYDPEKDVLLRDSPLPTILHPRLEPSVSPDPEDPESEEEISPISATSSKPRSQRMTEPSQGDVGLPNQLGGGKVPAAALGTGRTMLRAASEDVDMADASQNGAAATAHQPFNLAALAAGALAHTMPGTSDASVVAADVNATPTSNEADSKDESEAQPSMKTEAGTDAMRHLSPKLPSVNGAHELAPIQGPSPKAEKVNGLTLPSISAQLGNISDFKHIAEAATNAIDMAPSIAHQPSISHSPPQAPYFPHVREPPMQAGNHASPPISPHDNFRQTLPSPGRGSISGAPYYYGNPNLRRLSQPTDGLPFNGHTPVDYSSSATETPSTDQSGSTPGGMPAAIDRMSIDGITNPQIGGFQCTYPGCTAQPFQTQYLLNSHANVHSSIRPHYCPVKGCTRSEGGKGFKRKNEMIRHGLVHESPGYVCPYCVDREHKYPRPDNLQRHVRVHHVDKDKDDPLLRDVLAQRPEGPSRGRRRRGGNN